MIGLALDLAAFALLRLAGQRPREPRQKLLGASLASDEPSGRVITAPEPVAALASPYARTCICGEVFEARNPAKIHCSPACKHAAHRERHRAKASIEALPQDDGLYHRTCPTCGAPFASASPLKRFCGSGCHPSRPRAKIEAGEAGAAGEDLGIRVDPSHHAAPIGAPTQTAQRRGRNGGKLITKSLPLSRCPVCFGPVAPGELVCDAECAEILEGLTGPEPLPGRNGLFGAWAMAPSLRVPE